MRLSNLIGPDLKDALASDREGVREALAEVHPEDLAEIVEDLEVPEAVELLRCMAPDLRADVVERLGPEDQVDLFEALHADEAVELLGEMDPDDAADVVQELDEDHRKELLDGLAQTEPEAAEEVRELAAYAPETAGGLMTTEFVALPPDTKVWGAIEHLRHIGREEGPETVYTIYVCHYGGKLLGVVSLRDLILADPGQTLGDIMQSKVFRVNAEDDQEHVAETMVRYDFTVLPVVDAHECMVGVVTVDDVVDVVIEEATEDAQMMGGVVPLEDSYFATSLPQFVWRRGVWLILLFLGQLLTTTVMEHNEAALSSTLALAVFIPIIIASGGNAGAQSSTLIIRAMAVGELELSDWWRVFLKELSIGLVLGVLLGAMGFGRALFTAHTSDAVRFSAVVGASILSVVVLSAMVGSLFPILIKRLGLDPAVSSTPLIASVLDVLGLLVYFTVAHVLLTGL